MRGLVAGWLALVAGGAASAQGVPAHVQSPVEALAQDAGEYARSNGVTIVEAIRRLRAQEESVAATDRIAATYADRLAGIAIEHAPAYRIVVLLTGDMPVAEETVRAGDMPVPILFHTGAVATRVQVIAAMRRHQAEIRDRFPKARGMGLDQRRGELAVIVRAGDMDAEDIAEMQAKLAALVQVPVSVRAMGQSDANLAIEGGSRVTGIDPENGRRFACTTGFVVHDATRTGVLTAAHCPDSLVLHDPDGADSALTYVGAWGARYQDVQVHVAATPLAPLFYTDTARTQARTLTSWRNRTSTRAGDAVCHRGERTGYSCAQIELTDYAPPGDLCAGPCEPVWVTVAGGACRGGDSGGPVFSGGTAFGILKGGNYDRKGGCNFYYYMSTDYLPEGWSLLHG